MKSTCRGIYVRIKLYTLFYVINSSLKVVTDIFVRDKVLISTRWRKIQVPSIVSTAGGLEPHNGKIYLQKL